MKPFRRASGFVMLSMALAALSGCAHSGALLSSPSEQASAYAVEAAKAHADATRASYISRRALENAVALQGETARRLEEAKKMGVADDVDASADAARVARRGTESAVEKARIVSACAESAGQLAASARIIADLAVTNSSQSGVSALAEKAGRLSVRTKAEAGKACRLAEELRREWLSLADDPSVIQAPPCEPGNCQRSSGE